MYETNGKGQWLNSGQGIGIGTGWTFGQIF